MPDDPKPTRSKKRKPRPMPPLMVRAVEAARLCGTSEASWWRWVSAGLCPQGIHVSGHRLWLRRDLVLWCRSGCPPCEGFESPPEPNGSPSEIVSSTEDTA